MYHAAAMGIGGEAIAVGIGIRASGISIWYRSIAGTGALPLSNWVILFQNRPGFGIGIFVNRYLTDRISDSPASKDITKMECTSAPLKVLQVRFTLHVYTRYTAGVNLAT